MDFAQVGNHYVSACPFCDKLYGVTADDPAGDAIALIQRMHKKHLTVSEACRIDNDALPTMADLQASLGPAFREADAAQNDELEANPDNGKTGWWYVDGIRHDATCKASSAPEAVKKCADSGHVGSWESPTARFIGEELPDVF